jgi:hypothetical protein
MANLFQLVGGFNRENKLHLFSLYQNVMDVGPVSGFEVGPAENLNALRERAEIAPDLGRGQARRY